MDTDAAINTKSISVLYKLLKHVKPQPLPYVSAGNRGNVNLNVLKEEYAVQHGIIW